MSGEKSWRLIVLGLSSLLLWGWLTARVYAGQQTQQPEHTHSHTQPQETELPSGSFTAGSLYQLPALWTTATEQRIRLGDLQGKARVLVMHYTSCEYACPILISILKNIEGVLEPAVHDKVGFVTVTFDPEHDTPAVLRAYSARMALDPAHWTLLRGAPEDTLELAVLLGVRYRKEPQGGFAHSNLITVLNLQGEIVHQHVGLQQSLADTIAVIRRVAQE
jgi:protein SCO1/2